MLFQIISPKKRMVRDRPAQKAYFEATLFKWPELEPHRPKNNDHRMSDSALSQDIPYNKYLQFLAYRDAKNLKYW
jgi:hypothetical protein